MFFALFSIHMFFHGRSCFHVLCLIPGINIFISYVFRQVTRQAGRSTGRHAADTEWLSGWVFIGCLPDTSGVCGQGETSWVSGLFDRPALWNRSTG